MICEINCDQLQYQPNMKNDFLSQLTRRLSRQSVSFPATSSVDHHNFGDPIRPEIRSTNDRSFRYRCDTAGRVKTLQDFTFEDEQESSRQGFQAIAISGDELLNSVNPSDLGRSENDFECIPISDEGDCEACNYPSSADIPDQHHVTELKHGSQDGRRKTCSWRSSKFFPFSPSLLEETKLPCSFLRAKRGRAVSNSDIQMKTNWRAEGSSEDSCRSFAASSLSMKGLIRICGRDAKGRPIVIVDASEVPPLSYLRSAALDHIRYKLDPIAEAGEYDLIFVMSPKLEKEDKHRQLPTWWCLEVYRKLPLPYRKNIKRIVFIHPTFYTKVLYLYYLSLLCTGSFHFLLQIPIVLI